MHVGLGELRLVHRGAAVTVSLGVVGSVGRVLVAVPLADAHNVSRLVDLCAREDGGNLCRLLCAQDAAALVLLVLARGGRPWRRVLGRGQQMAVVPPASAASSCCTVTVLLLVDAVQIRG